MAYQIYKFDDITFAESTYLVPVEDDVSTGDVDEVIINVAGGVFDAAGSERRIPRRHTIHQRIRVVADNQSSYYVAFRNLQQKVGVRGILYRREDSWASHSSDYEWKYARLMSVKAIRQSRDPMLATEVDLVYESIDPVWRDETLQGPYTRTNTGNIIITPAFMDIEDAIIDFQANGTGSKTIRVQDADHGIDWVWGPQTITDGEILRINSAGFSVLNDADGNPTDAYADFVFNTAHTYSGILSIAREAATFTVTLTGAGTFSLSYYEPLI